jgi:hypothetical protein
MVALASRNTCAHQAARDRRVALWMLTGSASFVEL